jgi:hypothetical protein
MRHERPMPPGKKQQNRLEQTTSIATGQELKEKISDLSTRRVAILKLH